MKHRFHALCPYFAMFPEDFAARWIERLSRPNDVLLDPFCGRGTRPFQALLMGRRAVGCDVNPVAYCVTRAKTNAPSLPIVRRHLAVLEAAYAPAARETERRRLPEFFGTAYRPETLRQLLFLRRRLKWQQSDTDSMIAAVVLGALHGESERSPSFLSDQMPHTISTKAEYSVRYWRRHGFKAPRRDVFDLARVHLSSRSMPPRPPTAGESPCGWTCVTCRAWPPSFPGRSGPSSRRRPTSTSRDSRRTSGSGCGFWGDPLAPRTGGSHETTATARQRGTGA